MNIVLADDEFRARKYLSQLLIDYSEQFSVDLVGEASDGNALIKVVREKRPDIVFVDIRMPECSGLEAIKQCVQDFPEIIWVVVSGYSEFEYAQNALRLGVFDYLIKPVSHDEVKRILQKAHDFLEQTAQQQKRYLKSLVMHLFHSDQNFVYEELLWNRDDQVVLGYCIGDENIETRRSDSLAIWKECLETTRNLMRKETETSFRFTVIEFDTLQFCIVCTSAPHKKKQNDFNKHYEALHGLFVQARNLFHEQGFRLTTFFSQPIKFNEIVKTVENLQKQTSHRLFWGTGLVHKAGESLAPSDEKLESFEHYCFAGIDAYKKGNYLQFVHSYNQCKLLLPQLELSSAEKEFGLQYLAHIFAVDRQDCFTLYTMLERICEIANQTLKKNQNAHATIQQMIAYIDAHFSEDIGIDVVSGYIQMTPNYLSTIFHAHTEKTFTRYLTDKRIEEAKKLLLVNPNIPISTIAQQVGYKSARYFSKKFHQTTGIYPHEYRQGTVAEVTN